MKTLDFRAAFKLRGKRFLGPLRGWSGKPLHPPLTDIPAGAYLMAPAFDLVSFFTSGAISEGLHRAAGYVLLAGAVVSVLTIATGLADWFHLPQGSSQWRLANAHLVTMVTLTILVVVDLALRFPARSGATTDGPLALIGLVILLLMGLGGLLGGHMIFSQGIRVEDGPTVDS